MGSLQFRILHLQFDLVNLKLVDQSLGIFLKTGRMQIRPFRT